MNFRIQYVLGVGEARTGDIGYKYYYEVSALNDSATAADDDMQCGI